MIGKIGILMAGIAVVGYVVAEVGLGIAETPPAIETAGHQGHDHDHQQIIELAADTAPTIALSVLPDPVTGWNLHAETTNFVFAPANSGEAHLAGQGHAHIYLNGEKLARLYGNWFHLGSLPEGPVELRVGLYSNDHKSLSVAGAPIADSITFDAAQ